MGALHMPLGCSSVRFIHMAPGQPAHWPQSLSADTGRSLLPWNLQSWEDFHLALLISLQFSSVAQLCLTLCTPWTAPCQASLSITNSRSLLTLISIELVMPSNHLILCRPLLLLPSVFPSVRVFSNESVLCIQSKVLELQLQHQSFQ